MEWKIEESENENPHKIIKKAIEAFSLTAKGLAELDMYQLQGILLKYSGLNNDFVYRLTLRSIYVKEYRMELFTFGYNADLEKINVMAKETIFNDLQNKSIKKALYLTLNNGQDFINFLEKVFTSKKFTSTAIGLIKIAEGNKE